MTTPPTPPQLTPSERLALSRVRLRAAMQPEPAAASHHAGPAIAAWVEDLKTKVPGASLLITALQHWWAQHPMRSTTLMVVGAVKAVAQPIAQRNPWGLAAGALLLGAAVAWSRPWRWAPRQGLLNGLGAAVVASAMAHLPLQAWLSGLMSTLAQTMAAPPPPPAAPPAGPDVPPV